MFRWRVLLLGLATSAMGLVHAASVVVVASDTSAPYVEAIQVLTHGLEKSGLARAEVVQLAPNALPELASLQPRVVLALGAQAAEALAAYPDAPPVLCALLPRSSFERALQLRARKVTSQFTAVYLDQPLARQLMLIQLALPKARRLGVLWTRESLPERSAVADLLPMTSLTLVDAELSTPENLYQGLRTVLGGADVLWALPDRQIYHSNSIQNILLAALRARVPMVAFSPAYVRAGALLALYSTPTQVATQALALVQGLLQGKALPSRAVYPSDFSVSVNAHVARSLGLTLDEQDLRGRLQGTEQRP